MIIGINARFLSAPVTGVQRFAREVAARLLTRGDAVAFVPAGTVPPATWPADRTLTGTLRGQAWEQFELPTMARGRCAVLLNPANTAPLRGPPHVLVLHDVFPLVRPDWYARAFGAWYRALIPAAARRAARVLTTSAATAVRIADVLHLPAHRIAVVTQGVAPFDRPARHGAVRSVLARFGITHPFVLATGAGDARKNVGFATEAVQRCAAVHGTSPALVLVGSADRRVFGRHTAGAPAATALGRVTDDELHALLTAAAAVLCPSFDEGFGRVPVEAMCCGAPALVTDHAAATELLADTPARLLPLDIAEWARALHDTVAAGTRVPAAVAARLRARFSWDLAADEVLSACAAGAVLPPAEVA